MTDTMRFWVMRPLVAVLSRSSRAGIFALAIGGVTAGCAATTNAPTATPSGPNGSEPNRTATQAPESPSAAPGAPTAATSAAVPARRRLPEITLDPKQPMRPLPELKVENIGLHIGGGPNDAETKAPFLSAIAERFPSFMDCYRKSEDPAQGGRFGVDLHIARGGGHPRIEQPRTSLRGPDFRACLSSVFESVDFKKPKQGPTTISYSLRFTLVEAP